MNATRTKVELLTELPADAHDWHTLAGALDENPAMTGFQNPAMRERIKNNWTKASLHLSCDVRVPVDCIGYVSQVISEHGSRAVREDALRMLARHVPVFRHELHETEDSDRPGRTTTVKLWRQVTE